eukprot:COSAG01_NODE_16672_length_1216_cov_1.616831_2_plen_191_part_00
MRGPTQPAAPAAAARSLLMLALLAPPPPLLLLLLPPGGSAGVQGVAAAAAADAPEQQPVGATGAAAELQPLDARASLGVLQKVDRATEAAKRGELEEAVRLEQEALAPLKAPGGGRRAGGAKHLRWRQGNGTDGYTRQKHALAHFRLAVALQEQGASTAAIYSFERAADFGARGASLNCASHHPRLPALA